MDSLDGCINTVNSRGMKTYFWAVWWNSATYGLIWNSHIQINITAWWHMVLRTSTAIWTHMVTLPEKTQQHNPILGSFFFIFFSVFVFRRETVSDFGSLSQTPANLWWLLAATGKNIEADQSDRTMTRVRQKGKWCHAAGMAGVFWPKKLPKKKKKLKCLSTHFA